MTDQIINLDHQQMEQLLRSFELLKFVRHFDFFYEGHVPQGGIILVNGEIHLIQQDQIITKIHWQSLIGTRLLVHQIPANYTCRVTPNSEIMILGKFDLLHPESQIHMLNLPL